MMTNREAMTKVLDYLEAAERKHYAECSKEEQRDHIYVAVRQVRVWFEDLEDNASLDSCPEFIPLNATPSRVD